MQRYRSVPEDKRVFVTVKAYPQPSRNYRETVCVAGITDSGKFIRLYPVMFRNLAEGERFKTYTWITVKAWKAQQDSRPESYRIEQDSIQVDQFVPSSHDWRERWQIVRPLISPSLDQLQAQQRLDRTSLGFIRPRELQNLAIEPEDADWTPTELGKLLQRELFETEGKPRSFHLLEKIPFRFKYRFLCEDTNCRGHDMSVISWEIMQSYRNFRHLYEADWESKFRQKYWDEMRAKDLHFFMGNQRAHPGSWLIIGLYYPPAPRGDSTQLSLF